MEILIHSALVKVKTTKMRLTKILQKLMNNQLHSGSMQGGLIGYTVGQSNLCNGIPIDQAEASFQANYDEVIDLMRNLDRLQSAIILSNAGVTAELMPNLRRTTVCGKRYTVAELIAKRKTNEFMKQFIQVVSMQIERAQRDVVEENEKVASRLDAVLGSLGKADGKGKDDKSQQGRDAMQGFLASFHQANDARLVDPLNLAEKLKKLDAEYTAFMEESDAALNKENALTMVDVDLVG